MRSSFCMIKFLLYYIEIVSFNVKNGSCRDNFYDSIGNN